ncbi:MAG: deoxyribonuclease IV [Candidatus Aegiribacteria sp.]|nr:deoxyribonuclease IV [Candidatus Aegiribacteria sp.]MBD3295087.1 deoxyribonuclease IV [Candidatus Fermentibacteria bacterium]
MLAGIHASVSGGLNNALYTLESFQLQCGQIFTTNQRQWKGRAIRPEEAERYRTPRPKVISHTSYLINLASSRERVRSDSRMALEEELIRMDQLKIRWTVLHPGAHTGSGVILGIKRIASAVRRALRDGPAGTGILLENTAGQGTSIGSSFEQLREILDCIGLPRRTGVCLDTCHAFAAGYYLSSVEGVLDTVSRFQDVLGIEKLKAIHMNDSKKERGSFSDRHARIGEGLIGRESLAFLASMDVFGNTPGIAETPGTDEDRARDILSLTDHSSNF